MSKLTLSACLARFICLSCSAAAAYAAGPTIDNEHVRVLTAVDHPHHKSALHRGPVRRLLDIYHAAAPALDAISPNAYVADFNGICAIYARAGNPLLIPETGATAGNLFWALGHHAALGRYPFGALEEDLHPEGHIRCFQS